MSLTILQETRVLAVLRAPSVETALRAADALVDGGITGLEITYSTPDAAHVIRELNEKYGDRIYLGAGTVTTADQATEAADAGARFLVSPGSRPELTAAMKATGRTVLTGALTPSEVMAAVEYGADVVKIFPASLGGPSYLRSLRGPFPDVPLMPTGGVTPENLGDWFAAGALAVGAGSDLVSAAALASKDWAAITRRAEEFVAAGPGA
ncbi:bifunctional 4-hydroxy-2-oxoglutarate aldolase/2-dehydro-3-deoxy-phosphogluconate aldolase [Mycetocola zhadangensis]|uniref:Bifunctional 4-hydroxy-2-oxoglutarate aldolase/2-dehydro-3-deoxy-phosphogluconate aldolase n=1 Tax=Mycetocola zhadangensis TaxID=1164595 RepID=A0A3L7J4I4_9MICO|nr:bifunctional 4-hydroxy-2-oxoglutarate aldolase/2-dehydro-3-deoxy-phosphogluconate aldolase [Mycetocola zhadangensis]RLQ84371.1 bifunctional 4-hydroxy-2-oxoglutarate aldolase/2-dehydro-3-deoxy-phosphogluconate aldolase [Mycetocola zhadangensis]GGE93514.1 bifunctional 2-keto-4-hydroxyglutarate aldolase/2-keto-3-deoxy-6-phosphogluconate aldolase [Mycetocola zhadangensis]